MDAKVTFFLRYKQAGVTFSLYQSPTTLEALVTKDPKTKNSTIDRFLESYLPLLGKGVECPYVRISNEAVSKDSEFYDTKWITVNNGVTAPAGTKIKTVKTIIDDDPDFHNTAALIQFANSSTKKGKMFMRFIPDITHRNPVGLDPDSMWDTQFDRWVAVLVADLWRIRCLKDQSENPPKAIKKAGRDLSGETIHVELDENLTLAPGQKVRISGKDLNSAVVGVQIIDVAPDAKNVKLRYTEGTTLNLGKGGTIRRLEYHTPEIKKAQFLKATGRKTGRPFDVSVGRRKIKR